jgi:hypothetical protein
MRRALSDWVSSNTDSGASVRFLEGRNGLSGLEVSVPDTAPELVELYRSLRRMGVQVLHVQLTRTRQQLVYKLLIAELNGAEVCRKRWLSIQTPVLRCVLGVVGTRKVVERRPTRDLVERRRSFRSMLQDAALASAQRQRRPA